MIHLYNIDNPGEIPNIESNKWLVSCTSEIENNEIMYYEWDFVSLTNLFEYSNDFRFINKLLLVWIKYLCYTVARLDDHVANALNAMINEDKKAADNSNPIKRFNSSQSGKIDKQGQNFLEVNKLYNRNIFTESLSSSPSIFKRKNTDKV